MSRSYKKTPSCTDGGRHKSHKEDRSIANRIYRKKANQEIIYDEELEDDSNVPFVARANNSYRKVTDSYNIYDYKFFSNLSDLLKEIESDQKAFENGGSYFSTYKDENDIEHVINWWRKNYYSK